VDGQIEVLAVDLHAVAVVGHHEIAAVGVPDFDDAAIETAVVRWRQERPGAPYGDHPGPPSTRTLGGAAP